MVAKRKLGKGLADLKPKPPMLPGDVSLGNYAHNNPPQLNAFEQLQERKKELIATASAWLNNFGVDKGKPIDTPENAARLKGFKSQANELAKEADAQRKKDQKPSKDEVEEIAAAYRPIASATALILDRIQPLLTDWLRREQAAIDAAAQMARETAERERRAAEQLQLDAERQMSEDLAGSQTNTMATIIAAEEQQRTANSAAAAAERAAGQRAKVGAEFAVGGQKRSAYLGVDYDYRVDDPIEAATALCQMHPDGRPKAIIEAIISVARYLHKQDRTRRFPGVTILEEQKARG